MAVLDSTSLHHFLEQFTGTFTPELARHFAETPPSPQLQARLDVLAKKANEGTLSEDERRVYATYVEAMDVIALLRAEAASNAGDGNHC